jgi:putative transposase
MGLQVFVFRFLEGLPFPRKRGCLILRNKQRQQHKGRATMNHHRNEYSLFQLIDRKFFDQLVERHGVDKGVRSLSTWELTFALVTSMTLRISSFRELEESLGIPRSTFGDALNTRFHGFFQDLCDQILLQIRGRTSDRKVRRGIRELLAIDSTECRVHGSLFSLPQWKLKQTQGHAAACKLHVVYDVDGGWIDDFKITGARKHDSPVSLQLRLSPGKTYVFDRAYNDLDFWLKIIAANSHFVTRLKECAHLGKLEAQIQRHRMEAVGVLHDGFYRPSVLQHHRHREELEITQIRHVIYRDPATKKLFHFVSSDLKCPAEVIAAIYKRRWGVELLFRWLKGHLDIRRLPVKNSNAVKIQLAVAVLVQLLLQLKKLTTGFPGSLWQLLRKIRSSVIRQILADSGEADGCRWNAVPTRPR